MKKDTFWAWACILSTLTVTGYILSGVLECNDSYTSSNSYHSYYAPPKSPTTIEVEDKGDYVYVTPTGKRYHYSKACAGENASLSSINRAMEQGLTGCKKCTR